MSVLTINKESFKKNVLDSDQPVVVKFWAPWCIYCRRLAPVVDHVADDYYESIRFYDLNVDEMPELAAQYNIDTIPTLIIFQDGKASKPLINPPSQAAIYAWLAENGAV